MKNFKVKKILPRLVGQKIISITECTGPIPCISIELPNCWIDIAVSTFSGSLTEMREQRGNFPAHQIVPKDSETIQARKKQLNG